MSSKTDIFRQDYEIQDEEERVPWLILGLLALILWGGVWWLKRM